MAEENILKEYRQKCRMKVTVKGEEKVIRLLFGPGYNDTPVGNRIYLEPGGWHNTDDVELVDVLPWE